MEFQYKVVSLFSGAGGMDLGFIRAGFNVIWANDMDKYACGTYRNNIGSHIVCGPIQDINPEEIPDCDLVIGGPPCQGFSVAGKMDPHDPRSKLIWDFFSVVAAKRPKYFIMENVPALGRLSKFESIREELFREYGILGYNLRYKILNSKDYEVPQSRERFILIGTTVSFDRLEFPVPCQKIISTREAIGDLGEPGTGINYGVCKAKITVAQYPVLRKSPYAGMIFNGLGRPVNLDKPAPTLPASMGGNKTPIIEENVLRNPASPSWIKQHHSIISTGVSVNAYDIEVPSFVRRLTVRESARIQGFPDDYTFFGSQSQQFKQIGNAVPPPLAYHIALTLRKSINGETLEGGNMQNELPLSFTSQ